MFNLRDEYQERIDSAMHTYYDQAISEIKRVVSEKYAHDIGALIAWGYRENDKAAENIFNNLYLDEKHLAALLDDAEWMNDELKKEDNRNYISAMEDSITDDYDGH